MDLLAPDCRLEQRFDTMEQRFDNHGPRQRTDHRYQQMLTDRGIQPSLSDYRAAA